MATYAKEKGFTVQTLASDTAASQFAGGSWASGGTAPTALYSVVGFGTQTAALAGGGYSGTAYTNNTFEYDGSSWTSGGSLTASAGQAREGHGVLTAGGAVAGYKESGNAVIANYETYDGTSFTEQSDLNTARQDVAATGSTTAALAVGGTSSVGPGSTQEGLTNVESYNGSSWTETTENNTGRVRAVSFPGAPAPTMIFVGGSSDSTLYANVETYNGSAWTEITDLNTARSALAGAGQAQTDGIVFGGSAPSATAATENWNGTTWTELADLSTARNTLAGAGTGAASALAAMGYSTAASALTEEFTAPSTFAQQVDGQLFYNSTSNAFKITERVIPSGSWASGGSLNAGHAYGSGFGTQNAAVNAFGGYPTTGTNTELYNGSSWTEVNNGNNARRNFGSFGSYTSGLVVGSTPSAPAGVNKTETWNGTSWTEVGNLPVSVYNNRGFGTTSTSGISLGGVISGSKSAAAYEWGGSSWTEITEMGTVRESGGTANRAPTTAGLAFGGESPSLTVNTETWDGTSWTEVNNMNTAKGDFGFNGVQSGALAWGGSTPASPPYQQAICEFYNGTSWTEVADLATGINNGIAPAGGAVLGLSSGGRTSPSSSNTGTEEWTAALSNLTITSS